MYPNDDAATARASPVESSVFFLVVGHFAVFFRVPRRQLEAARGA